MSKSYTMEEAFAEIGKDIEQMSQDITERAKIGIQQLSLQAHAKIVEQAQEKLKSTRQTYLDNLSVEKLYSSDDQEIWAVTLKKDAGWIEDGYAANTLIDRVIKGGKPAKVSKDGNEYKVIPFSHGGDNKKPSDMSAANIRLRNYVRGELKRQGLDQPIKNPDGSPKIGRAASVKITDPNQPRGRFNKPLLNGLTIYQKEIKNATTGSSKVKQSVMTFRVISEKQKGSGDFENKEWKGLKAYDTVEKEIDELWNNLIQDLTK